MNISELKAGMKQVSLTAKVIQISEPREVTTKFGEASKVATATIQDDSGTINMSLWNENIDKVAVNDAVQIENGYMTTFRGENQLNVGRYGTITVVK